MRNPTYCTPEDVATCLRLPADDINGQFMFSDQSDPTYDMVKTYIVWEEDAVDRSIGKTYREHSVKDKVMRLNTYWEDVNGFRNGYRRHGGYVVRLHDNVSPWDPDEGDRLEYHNGVRWVDMTDAVGTSDWHDKGVELDCEGGILRIRVGLQWAMDRNVDRRIRISYRYGLQDEIPPGITQLCALRVARYIMSTQYRDVRLSLGGDVNSSKEAIERSFTERIKELTAYHRRGLMVGRVGL